MLKKMGSLGLTVFLFCFVVMLFGGLLPQAESSSALSGSLAEKNAWTIWCILLKKGYTEEAIAGILGNIDQETGGTFASNTEETGGNGYGLIQWTPKSILLEQIKQAGFSGSHETLETQVEVIDWELSGKGRGYFPTNTYPYSGEEFKKIKDICLAARVYEKNRERPKSDHPERQTLAQKWYDQFNNHSMDFDMEDQSRLVAIALNELGNSGGEKFWSWYGYTQRVEWCAVFVSWCGSQAESSFEKFAYCPSGITYFKQNGQWLAAGKTPNPGAIIFFDWNADGVSDHVGLVAKCQSGIVYTIEGNSNDQVKQQSYDVHSQVICGYGLP